MMSLLVFLIVLLVVAALGSFAIQKLVPAPYQALALGIGAVILIILFLQGGFGVFDGHAWHRQLDLH